MNKIILLGRITRDPELKKTESTGTSYVKFDIAVDRRYKSSESNSDVDFIPIVAWSKQAEVICKYLKKGDCITLSGRLSVNNYLDKEGNKKYSTNVVLEEFRFISTSSKNSTAS
ncbi:single-stranded DNA-binding protein [Clostridium sp. HCP1S3_B4]|uniref:single-stranded DNA-binding protein n=1 Tax=unclassified Clostridium TaxID=2614128 RepID=UPI00168E37FC|nr:single-stranded DNA-binding protein [Clostridiales bacterium]MDY2729647.1 single-stranded DNA-binding protein [Clostridium sp.]NLK22906.1 single-stranded DNA-binding protein [Clostridiales bacterium]